MCYLLRIRWELVWAERHELHIAKHGITPDEAESALSDGSALQRRRGDRYEVIGKTDPGDRILFVVVEPVGKRLAVVVSARDAEKAERRRYLRRK